MNADQEASSMPFQTILDALRSHVITRGDHTAFTFLKTDDERIAITYAELDQHARSIAHGLLQHAEPGDRALMMYPAGLNFIAAFLGCLYAGIIAVPAYPPKKNRNAERILSIAKDCKPRLMLTSSEIVPNCETFASQLPDASLIATDDVESTHPGSLPEIHSDRIAFLQYTSGSTGTPKGVIVTNGNIIANELLIQKYFEFTHETVMMSWLPMFHDMGLIGGILAPVFVGGTSVVMAPSAFLQEPIKWLSAITEYKVTCTGAPNFAFDMCTRKITDKQKELLDLSSLTIAFNGAEPVRAQTIERFSQAFAECGFLKNAFFPCYGMAETTLLVSGGPPLAVKNVVTVDSDHLESHRIVVANEGQQIVSCGQVGQDLEVRIVDPAQSRECESNVVGEIWVHGSSVAAGYWNQTNETCSAFRAKLNCDDRNWLRTGDYGFVRDGELYVTGRLKDLIIIRGRNIYPQDIEQVAEYCLDFLGPNSCAAVSSESHGNVEIIIIAEGTRDMVRWCTASPDSYEREIRMLAAKIEQVKKMMFDQFDVTINHVYFVRPATFPRTSSGKLRRQFARRMLTDGRFEILYPTKAHHVVTNRATCVTDTPQGFDPHTYSTVRTAVEDWLRNETESDVHNLKDDDPFWTLGLDSVTATSLILKLEQTLGRELSDGFLHRHHSISSIVNHLEREGFPLDEPVIELVRNREKLEEVYRFRYKIYIEEMNRKQHHADHERKRIIDPLDKHGDVFAIYEGRGVVGTVRVNLLRYDSLDEYRKLYGIDNLLPDQLRSTSISTRLMLAPHLRKSKAPYMLASAVQEHITANGVAVDYCDCNDPVRPFLEHLGYRKLHEVIHPEYGVVNVMKRDLKSPGQRRFPG